MATAGGTCGERSTPRASPKSSLHHAPLAEPVRRAHDRFDPEGVRGPRGSDGGEVPAAGPLRMGRQLQRVALRGQVLASVFESADAPLQVVDVAEEAPPEARPNCPEHQEPDEREDRQTGSPTPKTQNTQPVLSCTTCPSIDALDDRTNAIFLQAARISACDRPSTVHCRVPVFGSQQVPRRGG